MREDPYDNQVGEAEFEDRGLMSGEYQTRQQVMEMEEILVKPNSRNQKYIKT
jgi:hypothetical protein